MFQHTSDLVLLSDDDVVAGPGGGTLAFTGGTLAKLGGAGETAIAGRLPVNPSGGVLSSNPIGASGMIRFAEAAIQVMGKAGEHQVTGARKALGHAYGGGSQYYSMWVVGSDKPGSGGTTSFKPTR